jgi:transcriptional antiterminator NusG
MEQLGHTGSMAADYDEACVAERRWYVLWTKSNCEYVVSEQLKTKGFEVFLPTVEKWSRRRHVRCLQRAPMFPGYLFVHEIMDKTNYLAIRKVAGLVRILGQRWDKLAAVPDRDIDAIQKVQKADFPTMPYPYLRHGEPVRITTGPLANVEGILLKSDPRKGLLVLSIDLLRQSVAVQVDCTQVTAA